MQESTIQRVALARLNNVPDVFCWRNNTGAARIGGRTVRFGQVGQADISGIVRHGYYGLRLEIEVKSSTGKQSDAQKEFEHKIKDLGGLYFLINSIESLEVVIGHLKSLTANNNS